MFLKAVLLQEKYSLLFENIALFYSNVLLHYYTLFLKCKQLQVDLDSG